MTLLDTRKAEVVAKLDVLVKQAQALWPKAKGLTYTVPFAVLLLVLLVFATASTLCALTSI